MWNTVLILAPHTDDGEFGCGGSIARFIEEGSRVVYAAFSSCRASVPAGQPADILKQEMMKSMDHYEIPNDRRVLFDYPVRHFQEHRQEILDDMIKLNQLFKPNLVFMPSIQDIHQDHRTIAEEAMRAFKRTSLLGYEVPWNNYSFHNQAYIKLEERHMQKKIDAIACYQTQQFRNYANPQFTRGLAITHGVQINYSYAEVFEVIRWVI